MATPVCYSTKKGSKRCVYQFNHKSETGAKVSPNLCGLEAGECEMSSRYKKKK